jgi:hypothetical protein
MVQQALTTAAASLRGAIAVVDNGDVVCLTYTHHQQQCTSTDTTARPQLSTTHGHSRHGPFTSACHCQCRLLQSEKERRWHSRRHHTL